jgi:GT2 family glycosyltransferase
MSPSISIIIPSWNNLDMLRLCLRSVAEHTGLPHQVVVHVNDGSDGTLRWVKDNGVEHTWTSRNVGICHAVNLAAKKCRGEYLAYLNDDMYVLPRWDQLLCRRIIETGDRELCYASGTMIQASPISPRAIEADYGSEVDSFQEDRLLSDYHTGKLVCSDWLGATWPPCCVHRKWFHLVGGYSTELYPGFYSDIDFSMKLWRAGCRRFWGIGSSLVYHFGERSTRRVRGMKKCNVKQARIHFLKKWGVLPSTFVRYYLRAGQPCQNVVSEPVWRGAAFRELLRVQIISMLHRTSRRLPPAGHIKNLESPITCLAREPVLQ